MYPNQTRTVGTRTVVFLSQAANNQARVSKDYLLLRVFTNVVVFSNWMIRTICLPPKAIADSIVHIF